MMTMYRCAGLIVALILIMSMVYFDVGYIQSNYQPAAFRKKLLRPPSMQIQPVTNVTSTRSNKTKLILIYTTIFGTAEWYNLPKSKLQTFIAESKCKVQDCNITYDKSLLTKADAVVFHDRDLGDASIYHKLSEQRNPSQRWLWFTSESPRHTHSLVPYNGLFNWTMNYKRISDVVLPYYNFRLLDDVEARPDPNINYAKGKQRKVAWLVSNGGAKLRNALSTELAKYTDVYIGGGFKSFSGVPKKMDSNEDKELKTYKFYLSMENSICTDYVTEKYRRPIENGIVPIVLGGGNYSNPEVGIPGSFINAADFHSPKELADYINYLDRNDTAYNEYFWWKQKYKYLQTDKGTDWPFERIWVCRLCEMLHGNLPRKSYTELNKFYDHNEDCVIPEKKLGEQLFPNGYK